MSDYDNDNDESFSITGLSDYVPYAKRMSVDFMGMRVSFPQYLRLKAIQREVIRMDQVQICNKRRLTCDFLCANNLENKVKGFAQKFFFDADDLINYCQSNI